MNFITFLAAAAVGAGLAFLAPSVDAKTPNAAASATIYVDVVR
jgi:hypothetical protein